MYPYQSHGETFRAQDLSNEFRLPYDSGDNLGGKANADAFTYKFPYPHI
jgi:hypothetical protein